MPDRRFHRPAPEPTDTPLSVTLRRRRVELGLTLQQIADRMDVSDATVQRWESGVIRAVRYDKLVPLAHILKVAPAELVPPEARKKDPPPSEDEDGFEERANRLIHAASRLLPEQQAFLLSVRSGCSTLAARSSASSTTSACLSGARSGRSSNRRA